MSVYQEVKERLASLQDQFDALFDEAENLKAWMEETMEKGEASPDANQQQVSKRLGNQYRELCHFIDGLDGPAADALLRLQDRTIILQVAEKGKFV